MTQYNQLTRLHKIVIFSFWTFVVIAIVSIICLFTQLSKSGIPEFTEIENPKYNTASIVYGARDEIVGKYYVDNRTNISYDSINPKIIQTLVNTEDIRYFKHCGIDFRSLFRVAVKTVILQQKSAGGGSTITQQLAKLLYKRPNLRGKTKIDYTLSIIAMKFREWITALKLERNYTKEEIISMYLNKFDFVYGAMGLNAASDVYFGKDQEELDYGNAAVLVGMLKNPILYNPKRNIINATNRRNLLLQLLVNKNKLNQNKYKDLINRSIDLSGFRKETHLVGNALHFRATLAKHIKHLLAKHKYYKADGTAYNIYTDGLKIYTAIDLNYQKKAEKALWEHMKWNQEKYDELWKYRNPWTYDANSFQKKLRKENFENKCRSSERYLSLRSKYLDQIIGDIAKSYPNLTWNDRTISKLINIEELKMNWDDEELSKIKEKHGYKEFMKQDAWKKLRIKWKLLQIAFKNDFDKEIEMKVFAYNEEGNIIVKMSPLDSIKYHAKILQAGLLAVNPHNGFIKAWVGGVDYNYFKFDHVESRRQIGSTIKPFVYATAISLQGISPCDAFEDIQYSITPGESNFDLDEEWSPSNANNVFTGNKYNLFQGLLYSKNSITIRLVKEMGSVEVIRQLLKNVGINVEEKLYNGQKLVPNLPSICLGAIDLSVKEMVGAYTTFANQGVYVKPSMVQRIVDKKGSVIYEYTPTSKQALNPLHNSLMVDMLRNNVGGRYGLGVNSQIGGKTGTTNDFNDGWFMSITPDLVTGVWVGGDDKWIRFLSLDDGQGYVIARPIVQKFIRKLEKDINCSFNKNGKFATPPAKFRAFTDCDKYKVETPEEEIKSRIENKKDEDDMEDEFDFEGEVIDSKKKLLGKKE